MRNKTTNTLNIGDYQEWIIENECLQTNNKVLLWWTWAFGIKQRSFEMVRGTQRVTTAPTKYCNITATTTTTALTFALFASTESLYLHKVIKHRHTQNSHWYSHTDNTHAIPERFLFKGRFHNWNIHFIEQQKETLDTFPSAEVVNSEWNINIFYKKCLIIFFPTDFTSDGSRRQTE